jgi:demethylmenaquinone methyltransferase/2-methoxy-6-polyprenyl-1,4-benzoquinol methylase
MARTASTPPLDDRDRLPVGATKVRAVDAMFDRIAPRYDLANRVLTFGLDVRWRRRTIARLGLPAGSRILDVACGTGDLCAEADRQGLRPIGLDRSAGMLAAFRVDEAPTPLVRGDALALPLATGAADGLVCGFALRNLVELAPFLAEAARVLRPGGRLGLLEVDEPANPVLRLGHGLYFRRVVPFVGGLISDRAAYGYLPRSVAYLPPRPELLGLIEAAGFADVAHERLSGGIAQLLLGTRR